jgi:XRE family transcriptional regulator, regulator of sulfur utilization
MTLSRRDLVMLLPALAATPIAAQTGAPSATPPTQATPAALLPAKVYHSAALPYAGDATKKARRFFYGPEQSGYNLEMHETVLGPGVETHPPHTHAHQEIIILVEGTVEVSMDGRTDTVEAGSVIFYEPNRPHNLRNTGTVPCRYYVVELRGKSA